MMKRLVLIGLLLCGGCLAPLEGSGEAGMSWEPGRIYFYSKADPQFNEGKSSASLDLQDLAAFILEYKELKKEEVEVVGVEVESLVHE